MTIRQKQALFRGKVKRNVLCAKYFICDILKDPRGLVSEERRTLIDAYESLHLLLASYSENTTKLGFKRKKIKGVIEI